jgi:hypothetical protein
VTSVDIILISCAASTWGLWYNLVAISGYLQGQCVERHQQEWIRQADYDMKTAQIMFENKRYIHAVFMCHLSIEKALKGLFIKRYNNEAPPKTHNLIFLCEKIGLGLSENQGPA